MAYNKKLKVPKVIVADEVDLVGIGLENALRGRYKVVAKSRDLNTTVDLVTKLDPDFVITGLGYQDNNPKIPVDPNQIKMEHIDRTYGIRTIIRTSPRTQVLVYSAQKDPVIMIHALVAGARGYVIKSDSMEDVAISLANMSARKIGLAGESLNYASQIISSGLNKDGTYRVDDLSERESEVLIGVAMSLNTKQIAGALFLSEKTVEGYRTRLYRKLKMHDIASLTKYAVKTHRLYLNEDSPISSSQ